MTLRSRKNIVVVCYLFVLIAATHIPQRHMPEELGVFGLDKFFHFTAYGMLTWLILWAIGLRSAMIFIGVLFMAGLVGVIDELTQPYVGRVCSIMDWSADITGAVTAVLFLLFLKRTPVD